MENIHEVLGRKVVIKQRMLAMRAVWRMVEFLDLTSEQVKDILALGDDTNAVRQYLKYLDRPIGDPDAMTCAELRQLARNLLVSNYARMDKETLLQNVKYLLASRSRNPSTGN